MAQEMFPIARFRDDSGQIRYAWHHGDRLQPIVGISDDQPFEVAHIRADGSPIEVPSRLLPPTPPGEKILCIGLNYRDHAIETGADIPSEPVVFSKFNTSRIGHGENIVLPKISREVDYEAEMVLIIGKQGRHIDAASALDHVAGITAGHDVSARDWQKGRPGGQWLLGKAFETSAPMGPAWMPLTDPSVLSDLPVQMRLNGERVQASTTAQLIFDAPQLIAHLSQFFTLRPGDLIFTGTPPGVGMAKDPPRYLQPSDVCEVHVGSLPPLINRCVSE